MKIAVLTDVHANFPALQATLGAIRREGCDLIFHTGDAIAIGPSPAECVDLLLDTPHLHCVLGNHELYFVDGLPDPLPDWMSDGEVRHQNWTREKLGPQRQESLAKWPMVLDYEFSGVSASFLHYGLTPSGRDFGPFMRHPTVAHLDLLFERHEAQLLFYGHTHLFSDVTGKARYINPGSLGCYTEPLARYCVAEFGRGNYTIEYRQVPYDDTKLYEQFERRQVPERSFLYQAFFGGRFEGQRNGGTT